MDVNRLWQIGAALAALGALALGWFFGVSPALDERSAADTQFASVQSANDASAATVAKLAAQKRQLPELEQKLSALLASVPASADAAGFVDELDAAAATSGMTVTGITVADAQQYKPAAPLANSSPAATPAPGATAAPAPGMPPVTSPLVTSDTMAVIPVDVTATGSYSQSLAFVKALQTGTRLYLVTKIATDPKGDTSGPDDPVSTTVSGYIYALTKTATAGGSAATPAPAPTP